MDSIPHTCMNCMNFKGCLQPVHLDVTALASRCFTAINCLKVLLNNFLFKGVTSTIVRDTLYNIEGQTIILLK